MRLTRTVEQKNAKNERNMQEQANNNQTLGAKQLAISKSTQILEVFKHRCWCPSF
jgi:hypothetical protein